MAAWTDGQDAIRGLAILSDGVHRGMLMLRFYLDESGDSGDPREEVIGAAGCIAPLDAWLAFEPAWKQVLDDYGVKAARLNAVLHSSGEFSEWDNSRRDAFLDRLMSILETHISPYGGFIGAAMPLPQSAKDAARSLFDLYYPSLMMCLIQGATSMSALPVEERMEVILDKRPGYGRWREGFLEVAAMDPVIGPRWGHLVDNADYLLVRPLQAADLVVSSLTLHVKNRLYRGREPHWLMTRLLAQRLHSFAFFRRLIFGPPEIIDSEWPPR